MPNVDVKRKRYEPSDPRLGRHVEHDPRSRAFAVAEGKVAIKTVFWSTEAAGLDQGSIGGCTGFSAAQLINTETWTPAREKVLGIGGFADENYALKIYHENTVLDGYPGTYPPDDSGSSGLAAGKTLKKFGFAGSYHHALSFTSLLTGLQSRPCIVGIDWLHGMFKLDRNYYCKPSGAVEGGHELHMFGVDVDKEELWCRQSWGQSWGTELPDVCPSQAFRFHFKDFQKLLAAQGDATFPVPVVT